jgi:hypothetical protein
MKEKKPFAEIIIGKLGGPKPKMMGEEAEEKDMEVDDGLELAKEILSAIESKDPEALKESLHAIFQSFEVEPHEEEE